MENYIVELKHITKRFPGVVAMKDMNLQIRPGEIHGLIGENGAGKSTLIKVLTGVHKPEEGEIFVNGVKQMFRHPNDAKQAGIACVYQELNIVELISVTDNIFINQTIKKKNSIFLDNALMKQKAKELMISLGQNIDVQKPCGTYGMGIQQMVEIAKALLTNAKLIIMDEPTSSLGEKEVEQLMKTVRSLKDKGIAVLFVSHKLEELFELCDRVTVMRDGEHVLTEDIEIMDNDKLIAAMVGRKLDDQFPRITVERGAEALRVEHLVRKGVLRDISFSAYRGEILGFSGLVGAGRTETMRAIFGADPRDGGSIYVDGKEVANNSPKEAVRNGFAFLTEDRKGQGLILNLGVDLNLAIANIKGFSNGIWYNSRKVSDTVKENVQDLNIKLADAKEAVSQLSGGNQQKVVIGKWINSDAEIYIFDEPTRGIDVGAKVEVYNLMNRLKKAGKCIIMVSSELPEILGMSDRVIVMREGRITGEISATEEAFNQEDVMTAAWGGSIA